MSIKNKKPPAFMPGELAYVIDPYHLSSTTTSCSCQQYISKHNYSVPDSSISWLQVPVGAICAVVGILKGRNSPFFDDAIIGLIGNQLVLIISTKIQKIPGARLPKT